MGKSFVLYRMRFLSEVPPWFLSRKLYDQFIGLVQTRTSRKNEKTYHGRAKDFLLSCGYLFNAFFMTMSGEKTLRNITMMEWLNASGNV